MSIKSPFFLGMARITVNDLQLDPLKHIDGVKVKALARDFQRSGCRKQDVACAVPALVNPTDLNAALARANLSSSVLTEGDCYPLLHFMDSEKPKVLYGDHRLRAVESLPRNERWWLVSLYNQSITANDRASVLQLSRHASTALNGRELAIFLAEEDQKVLNVWMSHMSRTHKSTFSRLKKDDDGTLVRKVQDVLQFRGLQYQYPAGNWERILTMRCREEVYAYLDAISATWKYILGTEVRPEELDESTVLALQAYCPAYSSDDCEKITKLFGDMKLFPSVGGSSEREAIGRRVLDCKRILTFDTFFKDFIYLKTCFDGLCQLLPSAWREKGSFKQAFLHEWDETTDDHEGEKSHRECQHKDYRDCYTELWLFAMRNFPCLTDGKASQPLQNGCPGDDHNEFRNLFSAKRAELACLASKHGFETDAIKKYKVDYLLREDVLAPENPEVSRNEFPLTWKERSNRPSRTNYIQCKDFLHRVYVHDATVEQKRYVTAYAIARDIVHCCWRPDIDRWVRGPEVQQHPQVPNKKRSLGETHNGPRQKIARIFGGYDEEDTRGQKHGGRNGRIIKKAQDDRRTDKQKEYETLLAEVATGFAPGEFATEFDFGEVVNGFGLQGPDSGLSATAREEKSADAEDKPKEQDGAIKSIGTDVEDKTHSSAQPLAVTIEQNLGRTSRTPTTEGSDYSAAEQRLDSDHELFNDDWNSDVDPDPFEREVVPTPQATPEAFVIHPTQTSTTDNMLGSFSKEVSQAPDAQTEHQSMGAVATAIVPDSKEHKKRSSRQSAKDWITSVSRPGDLGPTKLAEQPDSTTVYEPNDKAQSQRAGEQRLNATLVKSSRTINNGVHPQNEETRHQSVFPDGLEGVVKKEVIEDAPFNQEVIDYRQSIFPEPGLSGEVKGDAEKVLEILKKRGMAIRPTRNRQESVKRPGRETIIGTHNQRDKQPKRKRPGGG